MASNSNQTFVKLTLDLNSKAHAPAPGVLSILGQVVEAPYNYDLHLRVMLGTSVLEFSFTGLENLPALVTGGQPNLVGSTMAPKTDARQNVEDAAVGVDNHIPSTLDSEDTESLNSVEPIAPQKKRRRKDLHHHAVSNDAYGESESDDSPQLKSNKCRKLRKNRPAKGAYLEPPKDAHDIFEASLDFEKVCSQPAKAKIARDMPLESEGRQFGPPRAIRARDIPSDFEERHATQSKVPRAPKVSTPQKTPFPQKSFDSSDFRSTRTGTHGHKIMREMPDVYMGLDSNNNDNTKNNNLDAVLAQNGPVAQPSRKNAKRSRSPKRSRFRTPLALHGAVGSLFSERMLVGMAGFLGCLHCGNGKFAHPRSPPFPPDAMRCYISRFLPEMWLSQS
jgi:hypothetical protein